MHTTFAALASLLVSFTATEARAHAHLKSTEPAKDAVVAKAPTHIRLEYSEPLELSFSSIKLSGPESKPVPMGAATHGSAGETVLDVPVASTLAPGRYTVEWRILSKDGHKTKGTFSFTVKP